MRTGRPARDQSLLPASWTAAHLPALSPAQLAGVKSAVSVGVAPVTPGTPPQAAGVISEISHHAFVSGMHDAFLVAAVVALAGTAIALITRRGSAEGAAHAWPSRRPRIPGPGSGDTGKPLREGRWSSHRPPAGTPPITLSQCVLLRAMI